MFSLVPGINDSDVSSSSEKSASDSECCDAAAAASQLRLVEGVKKNVDEEHEVAAELDAIAKCTEDNGDGSSEDDASPHGHGVCNEHVMRKFEFLQKRRGETKQEGAAALRHENKKKMRKRKRDRRKKGTDDIDHLGDGSSGTNNKAGSSSNSSTTSGAEVAPSKQHQDHWNTLKSYLHVNDHMKGIDHGKYAPKSGLEKKLDEAVSEGDFETAEDISDELAKRELACKVAKAANARDYLEQKHRDDERRAANRRKRRKLAWGMVIKERWQMKGNM